MSRAPTFGSLFAGIGGFDLGFERAGMRGLWQVEIDTNCRKLLAARFPRAGRLGDIRECGARNLAPVDVICGGFPCQDLSVAGMRRGLKGKRSGLFYELVRIIDELNPRLVVWENVPGLLSSDRGRDFARVVHALAQLGYFGAWRTFDAQYIGVAQRRRRVFGVFARGDSAAACAAGILSLAEGLRGHPAPRRQAREEVAGTLGSRPARGGRRSTGPDGCGAYVAEVAGALNPGAHPGGCNGQDAHSGQLVAHTTRAVTSKWAKGSGGPAGDECQNLVAHTLSAEGADASEDGTGRVTPLVVADTLSPGMRKADNNNGRGLVAFPARMSGTQCAATENLGPSLGATNPAAMAFAQNQAGEVRESGIMGSPATNSNASGRSTSMIRERKGVRRLTPLECERLQGFPDHWTAGFSDSVRYRMTGNAVAVPCSEWLGRRIARVLKSGKATA